MGFLLISVLSVIAQGATKKSCGDKAIKKKMDDLTVETGMNASFKCEIDMACKVDKIEWYHNTPDGTQTLIHYLDGEPKESYNFYNVTGVQQKDEGMYVCIAGDNSDESNQSVSSAKLVLKNSTGSSASLPFLFLTHPSLNKFAKLTQIIFYFTTTVILFL